MARKLLDLAVPPEVLQLQMGDTCQVRINFDYTGDEIKGAKFWAAIGKRGAIRFDHYVTGEKVRTIPSTPAPTTYREDINIAIKSPMAVGTGYDMYAKILDVPGADIYSEELDNVIAIVKEEEPPPPPPQYSLTITISPPGGGVVLKSPDKALYDRDEVITLTAYPTPPRYFWRWDIGGVPYEQNPVSIQLRMNARVTAAFRYPTFP